MKWLLFVCLALTICSCKKDETPDPVSAEDKARAKAVADIMLTHDYHLTKYYSLTPIDYIDTDQVVKAETDLWAYVSPWLLDDAYSFSSNGDVTVTQNQVLIPADLIPEANSPTITRRWYVAADKDGVRIDFIGHQYQILKYRLVSFTDANLVVWAYWNNDKDKVYSEFSVVQ